MNKIDYVIINILLKICEILSKYSEKTTTTDIYTIKSLMKDEFRSDVK